MSDYRSGLWPIHQWHVSTLSSWAQALSGRLWIPFAFRLPAFASCHLLFPLRSWPFLAVGLLAEGQTSSGLSCSASLSYDRFRCPLYAGACGVHIGNCGVPFHVWLNTTVSSILSVAHYSDASYEDSLSFTLPIFALPWF